jgi:DNA-binding NtrC family response regulator
VTAAALTGTILVVDDDPVIRRLFRAILEGDGHEVLEAASPAVAREMLAHEDAPSLDAALLDVMMPDESGVSLLAHLRETRPDLPVVMATASADVNHAVAALRSRAFDYLLKPVASEDLRLAMRNAVERGRMGRELVVRRLLDEVPASATGAVFAGTAMRGVLSLLDRVKDSATPVMILGESGTGKEVVSRELHARSKRADEPFVAVNCAALPATLVESELFGYEKGAFTGANARKKGRFEEAGAGTLFLDEVGELELSVQAKLLRALQEREITRVGGGTVKVDCRIVVATHRDLRAEVRAGRFREDLFYRLDVIAVKLPPLRDRPEEIPTLSAHLLTRVAREEGVGPRTLTPEAIAVLLRQPLRGNVRELENLLRRSLLLCSRDSIGPADLAFGETDEPAVRAVAPVEGADDDEGPDGVRPMREYEKEMMLRALAQTRGSVTDAARVLGIGRTTFYRRAKKFSIPL